MAFWENVNAGLKKAVDEGWTAVRDSAKIGRNRYKLHTLHKQAEMLFTEIGGIVYDMAGSEDENPLSRPEVRDLLDDIKRIEALSADIEIEIEQTREHEADDGVGGAEEGAWPAAVSKEAYAETDDEEDMVVGISPKESGTLYEQESDELDDDTLGIAGDPQADDFGEGTEEPEETEDEAEDEAGAGADDDDTEDNDDIEAQGEVETEETEDEPEADGDTVANGKPEEPESSDSK